MSIYEAIKKQRMTAWKAGNIAQRDALSYIQGEIERVGKDLSDEKVLKILGGVEVAMRESSDFVGVEIVDALLKEHKPPQLSDDDIRVHLLITMAPDPTQHFRPTIGEAQGWFKKNFPGQYNGGTVSKIHKELYS